MAEKYLTEKRRLRDFLAARGVEYNQNKKTWRCPKHEDKNPSAVLYEDQDPPRLYCPVCGESWTVIDVAGIMDGLTDFKDMLKSVRKTLGISDEKKPLPVAMPLEEARKIYTPERVTELAAKHGKITGKWPYHTAEGDIIGMDIRLESEGKKTVLTFWYDGKSLRYAKPPMMLYNLPEAANSEKPILITEGCKCAELSRALDGFTPCTWNGGSAKAHLADWSPLHDRDVFIVPDDDDPGRKAALKIKQQLPQAKIIKPIPASREIKQSGADIEEALQIMSSESLAEYILNPENHMNDVEVSPIPPPGDHPEKAQGVPARSENGLTSAPFIILGVGDDGKANFITESGHWKKYTMESISKEKLRVLANYWYWHNTFSYGGKLNGAQWEIAIDEILRDSEKKDFDEDMIRGRGAWRDGEKISYHDGKKTYGEYDDKKIYLRLRREDIGIGDDPAGADLCKKIKELVFKLSFATPADAVRVLAWSVLAPFSGAMKFRPALLMTGSSGTGKTTIATLLMIKLSLPMWLNGAETTSAYIRQKVKNDTRCIVLDETEADTDKKRKNRNELLSLMRASTSDDAPDSGKGGSDGNPISYKMKNIFAFLSIDPTLESVADENRIFRINTVRPQNQGQWKKIETELKKLLTEKNCRAIRSLTWQKLKIIFALAEKIVAAIQDKTGRDYRSSYADALLVSAFMVVWAGTESPSSNQIDKMLEKYYQFQPAEAHRDEAEEMISRLMDEVIEILYDGKREKMTILEGLTIVFRGKKEDGDYQPSQAELLEYKKTLARHGLRACEDGTVAIAHGNYLIIEILNCTHDYHKILQRYYNFVKADNFSFSGDKTRRASVIKQLIIKREDEMTDAERLGRLF